MDFGYNHEMEALIQAINHRMPEEFIRISAYLHASPGELIMAMLLLLSAWGVNAWMRGPLLRTLKRMLYRKRREEFYRLLFGRLEKIGRPLRLFVLLYLLRKVVDIFFMTRALDTFFYALYWFFFLWFIYESIKFLLYATLTAKIRKQRMARRELFNLFLNITRVFIAFVLLVLILAKLGVDLTALITSLGVGGAIVGLSAKDTLTNFFDSIRLVSEDAFRQGDWIETSEVEGIVTEMGLTSTKLRTFDNALVTVPNTKLAGGYIKNWTRRMVGRRIKFHLRIKPTSDTKEIDRVLYEIHEMLHRHPDIVNVNKLRYLLKMKKTYEDGLFNLEDKYGVRRTLLVYLDEIGEYSMNILIYAFSISVDWEEWLRVKQDVIEKTLKILEESQLELAVPRQEILLERRDIVSGEG